ncbi:hypothetical protein GCM10017608_14570 [Agromyces luteolus]|uniref:DUF7144 domain-containing protein n=1 Tax=Agromyces luteolus TaxID=88373 RepID=A0A7C9LE83_9MICO|nr:hypothetical protein [Agromyces luteolus]MUN07751.1 hypothetical protein [Agromyces luteolus]GLK27523.1 hypothetical protein GCM10017608_14570 [Agromyces luteolus]
MTGQGIEGVRRPAAVTVVGALVWVNAALDLVAGFFLLTLATIGGEDAATRTAWAIMGSVSLVLGAIAAVVAFGLMRGNSVARIAITVIEVFSIIASVSAAITNPTSAVNEIVSALIAVAILLLLWSGESTRFFRGLAPDRPSEP